MIRYKREVLFGWVDLLGIFFVHVPTNYASVTWIYVYYIKIHKTCQTGNSSFDSEGITPPTRLEHDEILRILRPFSWVVFVDFFLLIIRLFLLISVAFGGIAGLFLGFSLLSGVEIIYYFTLRALCMVHRNKSDLEKMKYEEETRDPPKINLGLNPDFKALTSTPSSAKSKLNGVDQTSAFVSRIVTQGGGSAMKKVVKYPAYPVPFLN